MTFESGKLRHRIIIEAPIYEQDSTTGAMTPSFDNSASPVADVWAAIEPLSARDLIAAQAHQSKVVARIVIRYRNDIDATMRINHNGKIYMIEGLLPDKDSGLEYLTIPVSEGLRDQ